MRPVALLRDVKVGEAPIDYSQVARLVIDNHVAGLQVAVHDPIIVRVCHGLENFVGVQSYVHVCELARNYLGLNVWHIFVDENRSLRVLITQDVVELDNIWAAVEGLEDFDLPEVPFDFDWFENFEYARFVIGQIDALKDLRVRSTAQLFKHLVVFDRLPNNVAIFTTCKALWPLRCYKKWALKRFKFTHFLPRMVQWMRFYHFFCYIYII